MRQYLKENGENILETLGAGASQRISDRISEKTGKYKSRQTIYKVLKNELSEKFIVSDETCALIGNAVAELLTEKTLVAKQLLTCYKVSQLQAA